MCFPPKKNSYLSISGLKFELNSAASHLSSNWIAAVPKLVDRRGALVDLMTESNSSKRRNSYDSESYTYSVRRVSEESRRQSLDSQISLQISEVTATHKTKNHRRRSVRSRGKRRRKDFSRSKKNSSSWTRRGSSTSQESQIDIKVKESAWRREESRRPSCSTQILTDDFCSLQILTALAFHNSSILPNLLKRRLGNVGLESSKTFSKKKFSFPNNLDNNSEEEPFRDRNNIMCFSDDDVSNGREEELCLPGEGIQALTHEDSEDSDVDKNLSIYQNYSDDEENVEMFP